MKISQLAKHFANLTSTVDGLVRARQVARSAITVGDTEVPLEQLGERAQAMADELTVQAGEMTATREYIKTQEKLIDDHHERLIDTTAAAATAFEHAAKAVISVDQAHAAADDALEQAAAALTTASGKNARKRGKTQPTPPEGGWVQGDQWIVENETGQPVSVKVWNGTAFVPDLLLADQLLVPGTNGTIQLRDGSVTATNLAVDALDFKQANGMNLNGGTISGGEIQLSHIHTETSVIELDCEDPGTFDGWGENVEIDYSPQSDYSSVQHPRRLFDLSCSSLHMIDQTSVLRMRVRASKDAPFWVAAKNSAGDNLIGTVNVIHTLRANTWQTIEVAANADLSPGRRLASLRFITFSELSGLYIDVAEMKITNRTLVNEGLYIGRKNLEAILRIDDETKACEVRDTGLTVTRKSDKKRIELSNIGLESDFPLWLTTPLNLELDAAQIKLLAKAVAKVEAPSIELKGSNTLKGESVAVELKATNSAKLEAPAVEVKAAATAKVEAPTVELKASTAAKVEAPTVEHKATSTVKSEAPTVTVKGTTTAKVEGQNINLAGSKTVTIAAPTVTVAGQQIHDTGWHNLKLASGWKTVTGHTPRARVRNGTLFVEGAARRETGGALTHIATLPKPVLSKVTGNKDTFVGAYSALKTGGAHAHGELYLTTSSGVIGTGDYTTLDQYAGWVVPLTFTISADQ